MKVPAVVVFFVALSLLSLCVSAGPISDSIDSFLGKRQAKAVGLGGGGGAGGGRTKSSQTCTTCLQSIKGYTPPSTSETRKPSNIAKGSIINVSDIPGFTKAANLANMKGDASPLLSKRFASFTTTIVIIVAVGAFTL